MFINPEKRIHKKSAPCANREPTRYHPKTISQAQKYCIIFGQPSQAEQQFLLAVIFIPIFKYD